MVTPHRLSSPQYISALCGEYAATNDHPLGQEPKNQMASRAEFKDLIAGRLAWPWACEMRGS